MIKQVLNDIGYIATSRTQPYDVATSKISLCASVMTSLGHKSHVFTQCIS